MKLLRHRGSLVLLLLILGLCTYWFSAGVPRDVERAGRLAVGACFIFVVPGLAWGEVLRLRGRTPLETIALSFGLTLTLEVTLLALVLPFGVRIGVWVGLLLGSTGLALLVLAVRAWRGEHFRFMVGLTRLPSGSVATRLMHLALTVIPLLLGVVAYRWGEDVQDLGGEKYIHMTFVRYYFDMPLVLSDLGIDRGLPPPNLIHLWEFLIAAWARCIQVDPLPVFSRARCVIPVLGLAGMYLLSRMIFVRTTRTAAVFGGVLLLAISQSVLGCACLNWVQAVDRTRGVFAFLGSSHHGDSAMDLLLALSAAVALWFMRQPRRAPALIFAGVLAANFLWHPREFMQLAFYLGTFAVTALLLPSLRRPQVVLRAAMALGIVVAVATAAALVSFSCVGRESHGYNETALKRAALGYALQAEHVGTVRNLFNHPLHFGLSSTATPDQIFPSHTVAESVRGQWQLDTWLFLAAGGTVLLGFAGTLRERQLAFYHLLLWLFGYCWNFSMLVILALTYSEFFMTMPRLLYLFSYFVIADGALVLGSTLYAALVRTGSALRAPRVLAALLGFALAALAGYWFHTWDRQGKPGAAQAATALTGAAFLLFVHVLSDRHRWLSLRNSASPLLCTLLVLAFLTPVTWRGLKQFARTARASGPPAVAWFADTNPFGYSKELLAWARTLTPGHKVASNPTYLDLLSIYTPQYLAISPVSSIIKDIGERSRVQAGQHPIFRAHASTDPGVDAIDHAAALAWLRQRRVDYVIVDKQDYGSATERYFRDHPALYELAFDNPARHEVVFHVRQLPDDGNTK
jgi:hypothetical protein